MSDPARSAPEQRPAATGKGARRRAELLDAAERILHESGYPELTMRAVAALARTRLGHLQYYFPTRSALVAAVLRRTLDRSLDRLTPLLDGGAAGTPPDPEGVVRRLLTEHDDPRLVRVYAELWALAGRDETVAEVVRAFYRDYRDQVAAFVRARDPGLPEATCQARAEVFTMLLEGASLFRSGITAHRAERTDAQLTAVAAALLDGGTRITTGGSGAPAHQGGDR
ncbi:TetR/AcrR family transcriptional regulator [Streptantibioticus cattleyicolor]|uniref:Transcriptional regulator, TetR family n=1 Tax=Streptantibioticus cattleyicolor (strain ATCC 35852 / DSM 46488 / JCM 4925 / NBRC 14057 / NRRL 8057) TaxID=1003195 RepID=F8JK90_STREN|nr:TetR/AcrR family transcriptional regulator [Streptantibioticus cattleyicolor]AEW98549.1 transcriptional regulator, TetR family [Streptantibioticus cattleyicolor NRRL 8057 = DSM 46488]CCB72393.1 Transcriptional regulator, TetR family [Streptantibioticus cattleyicolor NRRL 8057 = DSM 46488]